MKKPSVFITRSIPLSGIEILAESCEISIHKGVGPPKKLEILNNIRDKDGLLCMLTDNIDIEIMEVAKELKVISTFSVGVNHIDISRATKLGIYVTFTPGVLTEATADLAFSLLLASSRKIIDADNYIRNGNWKVGWSPTLFLGRELSGKKLGIIGLGRIGTALARRALGFNMEIIYHSHSRNYEKEREMGLQYRTLKELLKESDYISLHIPLTNETENMINNGNLKLMKREAIIINTSRGEIINENDLIKALENRLIAGAGLDVFSKEPLSINNKLLNLNNVVLTPHIGSATHETRNLMSEISAKNLITVFQGIHPPYLFNEEVMKIRPLSKVKMLR